MGTLSLLGAGPGRRVAAGGPSSLLTGLVAYWTCGDGAAQGTDASGNGNDLTAVNSPTTVAGKVGNAISVTAGANNHLSHADAATYELGSGDFTLAGWKRTAAVLNIYNWLVGKMLTGGQYSYRLLLRGDTNKFTFDWTTDGSSFGTALVANNFGAVSINTWYFVALRRSGNTLYLSVNGGTEDTIAFSGTFFNGTDPFTLAGGGANPGDGLYDEWGYWNVALTPTQIGNLYAGGAGATYPFVGIP